MPTQSSNPLTNIHWPVVIRYHGNDELLYVASEADWLSDPHLCTYDYDAGDEMIDQQGQVFRLDEKNTQRVVPRATGQQLELEQFIFLVRLHVSALGQCCIGKIVFGNFAEGMQIVASLSDN